MSISFHPDVDPFTGEAVSPPFVRSCYSRLRIVFSPEGESMTHQGHRDSCDVNQILARYERTGEMPPANRQGAFTDVSGMSGDFGERVLEARRVQATAEEFARNYKPKRPEQRSAAPAVPAAPAAAPTPSS